MIMIPTTASPRGEKICLGWPDPIFLGQTPSEYHRKQILNKAIKVCGCGMIDKIIVLYIDELLMLKTITVCTSV